MENVVFASYFNNVPDPQRDVIWNSQPDGLFPLINSVVNKNIQIKIFHDCFNRPPVIENCDWIRVEGTADYTPTVYRWIVYNNYLQRVKTKHEKIFCVDSTDVEMLSNPFSKIEKDTLYSGSEYKWKMRDKPLLKKKKKKLFLAPDFMSIIENYSEQVMLNAGIIGGNVNIVYEFIEKVAGLHKKYSKNLKLSADMPVFNYVALKYFNDKVVTGYPIHTPFTDYCYDYNCWWKHK